MGSRVTGLLVGTVVATALLYAALTAGLDSAARAGNQPGTQLDSLPALVADPPPSVATTTQRGPVGAVSLVFAASDVQDGLVGHIQNPWIAVAADDGDYRALDEPDLPPAAPGALAVAPAGDLLAWTADAEEVVLLDAVTDERRSMELPGAETVGAFSPDGRRLLVHDGSAMQVVDTGTGEVVASRDGVGRRQVVQAAWTADGSAVTYVQDGRLVRDEPGGDTSEQPTVLTEDAALAWSPDGRTLVTVRKISRVNRMERWPARPDGTLGRAERVPTTGVAVNRMLGFTGPDTVAITALRLDTGALVQVLDVPLDGGGPPDRVAGLPPRGPNFLGPETVVVSAESLLDGFADLDEPTWPWSDRSKLVAAVLVVLVAQGSWLTRRRHRRRRRWRWSRW
jgi:hypothetical protein